MLVDLASLTVLPEQATQHTLTAHPLDLGREASLSGTLTLTVAGVTTDTLGGVQVAGTLTRVRDKGLLDNLTILDQLANVRAGVRVRNVALLSGVEPDLTLTHTEDGRSQTPLNTKVNHDSKLACVLVCREGSGVAHPRKVERKNSCWLATDGVLCSLVGQTIRKVGTLGQLKLCTRDPLYSFSMKYC